MDKVTFGPERGDGLPEFVIFHDAKYDTPDYAEIEGWVADSVCESLMGETVEPDGIDEFGSPSWLLALGLI